MTQFTRSNRGTIAEGLNRFLGVIGKAAAFAIGDLIQPVFDISTPYPFQSFSNPVMDTTIAAATAAENGYCMVDAGLNCCLEIQKVDITNRDAAVAEYRLVLLTLVQAATTIGIGSFNSMCLVSLTQNGIVVPQRAGSSISQGTHGSIIGREVKRVFVGAQSTLQLELLPPIYLWNNGPEGASQASQVSRQLLAVVAVDQNKDVLASFSGREWPLPVIQGS